MHSYNLCNGTYHLTKFLVLDSISHSASYCQTFIFHLCFGFETVIDLNQDNGIVSCTLALYLHVYIALRLLTVVLSVQLICLVCKYILFFTFNGCYIFKTLF